jgi:hypothetical protein
MSETTYVKIASTIFTLVALLHLMRIVLDWPAVIGGWDIPMWVSWVGLVVATALAFFGFKLTLSLRSK